MSSAQIKNSFSSIGEVDASLSPSSLILKIAITNHSVRYFVLSQTHHQIIFLGDYTLHHVTNFDELAAALEKIFQKDEILKLSFAKILIGFDDKYSLVPAEFSDLLKKSKQLSTRCVDTDIVFENSLQVMETLKNFFSCVEFLHLNSTYFNLLPNYLTDSSEKLFVNVSKNYLDVIRFNEQKKLQLMNRYEYQTASDFIYFVLLCCEELKIDRKNVELVLSGEIDIQSKVYDVCYRYFRSISFIKKPDNLHFSKAFEMYPKHLHFNLYNISA